MIKFSWEPLDSGSLLLRVSDGDRETTWKLTKRTSIDRIYSMLWEIQSTIDEQRYERIVGVNAKPTPAELGASQTAWEGKPMREMVRTVDAEELAALQKGWEEQSNVSVQAETEGASLEALRARANALSINAKWWDNDDEESAFVAMLPDYDSGEI